MAVGLRGAVSSAEANASDIGVDVLRRGGNAVDAAVAVAFALGVTFPSAGNVGGGGFMLVRSADGKGVAIDYREVAPGAAHRDMYLDASGAVTSQSRLGPLAAGIPGVVAGLWLAHQRFGELPWAELVAPAVALARDGFELDDIGAKGLRRASARIRAYRAELGTKQSELRAALDHTADTFGKPGGETYESGEVWRQPELALTLEAIASGGPDAFYRGPLARQMARAVRDMGGIWAAEDLARYQAVARSPIEFVYHGHRILTMPPPSAGGIVLRQILAAADVLQLRKLDYESVPRIHLYVESLKRIYADRNELLGDPDFVNVPLQKLLDVDYTAQRMADIDPRHATPSTQIGPGVELVEPEQTTHFSVVDASGTAVANTFTLNGSFGAMVQIPGTGVTLNNEMDDFTAKVGAPNMFGLVQGPQNAIEPGKRMLSSMSPTILVKGGKVRAVVGSPGGPTITTTVAQIVMQLVDYQRSLEEAIAAPRVHHQWLPDEILYEPALAGQTVQALKALGHKLRPRNRIGHANCIEIDPETGWIYAVADVKRNGGKASAY